MSLLSLMDAISDKNSHPRLLWDCILPVLYIIFPTSCNNDPIMRLTNFSFNPFTPYFIIISYNLQSFPDMYFCRLCQVIVGNFLFLVIQTVKAGCRAAALYLVYPVTYSLS